MLNQSAIAANPLCTSEKKAPTKEGIDRAANEAATSPTNDVPEPSERQKESGRYRKGHIDLHGLKIAIENPRGSKRSGTDADGKEWSVTMRDHYGFIKKTEGADWECIDVFVGPDVNSQRVFVVDQVNPDGGFDEHKIMIGYGDKMKARHGYRRNYTKDWVVGPITSMSVAEFKAWLKFADTTRPIAKQLRDDEETAPEVDPVEEMDGLIKELHKAEKEDRKAIAEKIVEVAYGIIGEERPDAN